MARAHACERCDSIDMLTDVTATPYMCGYCRRVTDFNRLLAYAGQGSEEQRMQPWQLVWLSRWLRAQETA